MFTSTLFVTPRLMCPGMGQLRSVDGGESCLVMFLFLPIMEKLDGSPYLVCDTYDALSGHGIRSEASREIMWIGTFF